MTAEMVKRNNSIGALFALAAMVCFSFNDMGIKFLSDHYALHQVVLYRSVVGMVFFLCFIMPFNGGFSLIRTRRLRAHLLRGSFVVFANMSLFLGLAAMPIADAIAVFFVSPMAIAVMSVLVLGETVAPRRWVAIAIGFAGVLVIVQPGTSAFQVASFLPALAAILYGSMHMITRRIRATESAATMAFYILLTFIVASSTFGLLLGDGRYADSAHPSLAFLLRAWQPLEPDDIVIIIMLGITGVVGGVLVSQAYRLSEAAFAAPFEYIAMPLAIMWGVTVFGTWPQPNAWAGIALIIGSGFYLLWSETNGSTLPRPQPRR
ncbi:DMT family transporter [Pseudohalocynthiibacter aestuariivivens]|uniref:DMT family transporter n=1 Tax=Roseovarius pelagicus TaxID=2980108 RepID=A0ABY6DGA8_9RHOB|nr:MULTISPECIES: DMT family transporter [Rhodobacterales]QIE46594.1 DMT family transporter [Pseudohalocynthiibacter aestuariivivens]UXX84879.1 DMT family transporter [Roseovarius pelagicus]